MEEHTSLVNDNTHTTNFSWGCHVYFLHSRFLVIYVLLMPNQQAEYTGYLQTLHSVVFMFPSQLFYSPINTLYCFVPYVHYGISFHFLPISVNSSLFLLIWVEVQTQKLGLIIPLTCISGT